MNVEALSEPEVEPRRGSEPVERPAPPPRTSLGARVWKVVAFLWKYWFGAVACTTPFLAVLVVGWTYRLVQRSAFHFWWKHSKFPSPFPAFADGDEDVREHRYWPNWILEQRSLRSSRGASASAWSRVRRLPVVLAHSLWLNLKLGLQGVFNTWVMTMPACSLWLLAWVGGWNNSFHKHYELAAVGPTTGLIGIGLYIVAMLYVPLAQARQAATGSWRAFYDVRLVRRLIRLRWGSCLVLAGFYTLASTVISVLFIAPLFLGNSPGLEALSDVEAQKYVEGYYFYVCVAALPMFVLLRLFAGRIYSSAVLAGVRRGAVTAAELAPVEQRVLGRLDLLRTDPERPAHPLAKAAVWTGSRLGRSAAFGLAISLWFTFAAQIFVVAFFNYQLSSYWLNQPLVQLPHFSGKHQLAEPPAPTVEDPSPAAGLTK